MIGIAVTIPHFEFFSEEFPMFLMCKINKKCSANEGPCIHEWMMVIALVAMPGVLGHWVLDWF